MRMFQAYGKRVRVATTVKAYMMLKNGATFDAVATRFAKGNHLFADAIIKHAKTSGILTALKDGDTQEIFDKLGTEYLPMREAYLSFLDDKEGIEFSISYHFYTSHNTKSRSMTERIKAFNKARAQQLLIKKVGGDAVITHTY